MDTAAPIHMIKVSELKKLQAIFQKEPSEFINLYIEDSAKKIQQLHKSLQAKQHKQLRSHAKELRLSSMEVGAVKFSFLCLSLELAATEHRLADAKILLEKLDQCYPKLKAELERVKSSLTAHQ